MNDVIISTKGTLKNQIMHIISCVFDLVFAFILFFSPSFINEVFDVNISETFFILGGIFFAITGIWSGLKYKFTTSYLDIYTDKYVGKGIQQFNVVDFNLNKSQVDNLTVNETSVILTSNSGTYKIMTDKKTAYRVFEYYNQSKIK